ncbi:hypothetical protein [Acinetobacter dispersus]|uniref:hypothetical protein n=1 Tax=Acinetobacter dispersus TaxID=70348 RepID=UPI0021CD949F|nr:hypothetical protein [Acinetobacter dispersus]MCU4336101.1 hypothetical protein [Acinetobacter dispersus]
MIDLNSGALSTFHIHNVTGGSAYSGSVVSQHVPSPIYIEPTASLKINIAWLKKQTRSGQNFYIVENKMETVVPSENLEEITEIQRNALEEKIELIKSVFSMTEMEISQSIGVSRKTLFNWKQKESAPNKRKAQNIFELYLLAKNWKDAGFTTDSFELETPVIDDKSIKDLLKEDKIDSEKILFAGNRLSNINLDEIELF